MNNVITVNSTIELCINGTTYKLRQTEAESLFFQLADVLNRKEKQLNYPPGVRSFDTALYKQGDISCGRGTVKNDCI